LERSHAAVTLPSGSKEPIFDYAFDWMADISNWTVIGPAPGNCSACANPTCTSTDTIENADGSTVSGFGDDADGGDIAEAFGDFGDSADEDIAAAPIDYVTDTSGYGGTVGDYGSNTGTVSSGVSIDVTGANGAAADV
jgi:hypothetical protein